MSDSEDELAVLAQLQQYINDGSFTTETFLSGKFQDTLREAKLILVEDPHGGSHRWHHMSVRDSKQKEGYESPVTALAAAVVQHNEDIIRRRELLAGMDRDKEKSDKDMLEWAHPTLTLSLPWSSLLEEQLSSVDEAITLWGTDRQFVKLQRQEGDAAHITYLAQSPDEDLVIGTIHVRAIDDERTEVIYVPAEYHRYSAIVMSSLYRLVSYEPESDTASSAIAQLQEEQHDLDLIFDAWYVEKKKGKRITLKQWAAQANVSYHYLSRHHKAYKKRQLAKTGRKESE